MKFENQLGQNGYRNYDYKKNFKKYTTKKEENKHITPNLILPFINDKCDKKIKALMKKHDLGGRLISKPNMTLDKFLKNKKFKLNTCNCQLCEKLGDKNICTDRYVVYKYSCKICGDEYIGKTARTIKQRHNEHRNDLNKHNQNNALVQHVLTRHTPPDCNIDNFDIAILSKKFNSRDTTIEESRQINIQMPRINRKQELSNYPLICD